MVSRDTDKGHPIYYDSTTKTWRYSDNFQSIKKHPRPCRKCGHGPTKKGYDHCLGHIKFAKAACCGHGNPDKKYVYYFHQWFWNYCIKATHWKLKSYVSLFYLFLGYI